MPGVGTSVDRRAFAHVGAVCSDERIEHLVCFVCGQLHPRWPGGEPGIVFKDGAWVQQLSAESRNLSMSLGAFRERYAGGHQRGEGPFANTTFLTDARLDKGCRSQGTSCTTSHQLA